MLVKYIQGDLGKIYIMGRIETSKGLVEDLYQAKFNNSTKLIPFYGKDLPYWLNEIGAHTLGDIQTSTFPGSINNGL